MISIKKSVSAKNQPKKWEWQYRLWHGAPTVDDVIVDGASDREQVELAPDWLVQITL